MTKGQPRAELQQPLGLGGVRRLDPDPEPIGRPPQQRRVAGRLRRREQQQPLGGRRKRRQPPPEDVLDTAGKRPRARQPESAGQLRRRRSVGQLEQGQRVAAGLGDNPVADSLVQAAGDDRGQQGPGVSIGQSLQRQPGKASEVAPRGRITGAEQHGDGFGVQPAGSERQGLGRGLVQPLRIVDQAQQRLVRGHVGQQAQNGQADMETIRRAAQPQAERDAESLALRDGQLVEAAQHPPAQLVQRREGQLHLRLDTLRPCHLEVLRGIGRVTQQRGLADARLAAHHQRPAVPRPDVREQPVEGPALFSAAP